MSDPIFHLSFPVRDLEEALEFYASKLGGTVGRREENWADVALFGAQVTLQLQPQDVLDPMPRSRHFGATLPKAEWDSLVGSIEQFVEGPDIRYKDTEREQSKAMIVDPSGNFIELKTYRNAKAVLGDLAGETG